MCIRDRPGLLEVRSPTIQGNGYGRFFRAFLSGSGAGNSRAAERGQPGQAIVKHRQGVRVLFQHNTFAERHKMKRDRRQGRSAGSGKTLACFLSSPLFRLLPYFPAYAEPGIYRNGNILQGSFINQPDPAFVCIHFFRRGKRKIGRPGC